MAGASPEIARAVADAAAGQVLPYGNDPYTERARRRLGEIFERDVDVFPVSTGSAANGLSLAALTPPWGSVLSHPESHINTDECGAPEFFTDGAKLVGVPGPDSKIDPDALETAVRRRAGDVHSVQPSVVSISQATESGSVYTLEEIRRLSGIAEDAGLRVHMDGAGLLATPQANILFCRLPQHVTEGLLAEGYAFYHDRWEPGIVRFVTAFSHSADDIDQLLDAVRRHTR